jgi:predicted GNAT family N-acyltransferase
MHDPQRIEIRLLQESDIAAAMELKEFAGWNQTENDWHSLLKLEPDGCFAAVLKDQLVGTTTTTRYGRELAWIGMVLVRPENRRSGIATQLLQTALSYLNGKVRTVKLDATADGKPVYERFGFQVESLIERWGRKGEATSSEQAVETIDSETRNEVFNLDRLAFGADRSKLINMLLANSCVPPLVTKPADCSVKGYALARSGSNATYVGPIVSSDRNGVTELLDQLLQELNRTPVYIDLNLNWNGGGELLAARGFEKQRDLIRMRFGTGSPTTALVFAIAGPEIG